MEFKQDLTQEEKPGGPFLMQLLFKKFTALPNQNDMMEILQKYCGGVTPEIKKENMISFASEKYKVETAEGKIPVMLSLMECMEFEGEKIDAFTRSQMWDCIDTCDEILKECKYTILAVDFMAASLPPVEHANLAMDFMQALVEVFPTCEAVYVPSSGNLITAQAIRQNQMQGTSRFIRFGVNMRFFNVQGKDEKVVDSLGMGVLFLPDLQYHFHTVNPDEIINHAYNMASYLLENENPIKTGDTIDGMQNGRMVAEIQWKCQYENSLIQPAREVIDIHTGEFAGGTRHAATSEN